MASKRPFKPGLTITVLKRNWPVMGLYALILCLFIPSMLFVTLSTYYEGGSSTLSRGVTVLEGATGVLTVMSLFASFVAGIICFSHLYTMRASQFYLSLPLKRVRVYLELIAASFIMMIAPLLLCASLCFGVLLLTGNVNLTLLWKLVEFVLRSTYSHLFFLSVASACAIVAGNFLAYVSFYGVINFVAFFLVSSLSNLYENSVYGMVASITMEINAFAPVVYLASGEWEVHIIAIYTLIGVALFVLSALAYHRRKAETAGDVVTINTLRPVFKYGFAACFALAMTMLMGTIWFGLGTTFYTLPVLLILMISFGALGYIIGDILVKRTFRIGIKTLRGLAVFACAISLAMTGMVLIPSYMARITPDFETIAYTDVNYTAYQRPTPYYGFNGYGIYADGKSENEVFLRSILTGFSTDGDSIEAVRHLNAYLAGNYDAVKAFGANRYGSSMGNAEILFKLTDGRTIRRRYPVYYNDYNALNELASVINIKENIRKRFIPPDELQPSINSCEVQIVTDEEEKGYRDTRHLTSLSTAQAQMLYEAVKRDIENGDIGKFVPDNDKPYIASLTFSGMLSNPGRLEKTYMITINVWNGSKETRAALESLDIKLTDSIAVNEDNYSWYTRWGDSWQGIQYNFKAENIYVTE